MYNLFYFETMTSIIKEIIQTNKVLTVRRLTNLIGLAFGFKISLHKIQIKYSIRQIYILYLNISKTYIL